MAVAFTPYVKGRVIVRYRSTEMVHRLRMDAVQQVTSNETQRLHREGPSPQEGLISRYKANGITKRATHKSVVVVFVVVFVFVVSMVQVVGWLIFSMFQWVLRAPVATMQPKIQKHQERERRMEITGVKEDAGEKRKREREREMRENKTV